VPFEIRALVITVTSYGGATFDNVSTAAVRISSENKTSPKLLVGCLHSSTHCFPSTRLIRYYCLGKGRYPLGHAGTGLAMATGLIMAKLYRDADRPRYYSILLVNSFDEF
jgi:hypothetical protein